MRHIFVPSLVMLLASSTASAQVYITEVQPNPPEAADTGEYVELHNTSTVAVSIEGWTINDYTGSGPMMEAATRWAFPALTSLGAGQVIVVARQAGTFLTNTGMRPSYELADGADDPMVPNMVASMGTSVIQLVNGAGGDAVILRDDMGLIIDGCEYGNVDRSVAGAPQTQVPRGNAGDPLESLLRVALTGSSAVDFRVGSPTPFVGFTAAGGPVISTVETPAHLRYGQNFNAETTITDSNGLAVADIYLATATSSTGDATQDYVSIALTATTAGGYTFQAPINNLGPGIAPADPANFHSLYVRHYIYAENNNGQSTTEPAGASETADNTEFNQKNVMPSAASPISDAREQDANGALVWTGHSVTVRGTALTKNGVLSPNRLDVAIEDSSGAAIRVFNNDAPTVDVNPGDVVEAVGSLSQFRGVAQLAGVSSISLVGGTAPVTPTTVTIAELLADAESFESRLVTIVDADFDMQTDNWPGMGTGGNLTIKDATGTLAVRVTQGTDLFGTPAPQYGFDITGIVGQFVPDQGSLLSGYQLAPRGSEDIVAKPMPVVPDAGFPDTGPRADAGSTGRDAGASGNDAGGGSNPDEDSGCGCTTTSGAEGGLALLAIALFGLFALRRRS